MNKLLKKIRWNFFWWFNYFALSILLKDEVNANTRNFDLEKWGSPYGGWYVPTKILKKDWNYYLVGVGDDISFDLAITERLGAKVNLFDPTPESVTFMKKYKNNKKINFFPLGIYDKDTRIKFYKPQDSEWTSYSIVDLQKVGERAFDAEVTRLKSAMQKLGHRKIHLLKLDISGAEYPVLDDMIESKIFPRVLLVEFDQPASLIKTYKMIKKLLNLGYCIAIRDMWDFTFVKKE